MRSRFDMRFKSLRETFDDARSSSLSRPRLPRRSAARSAFDERRSALSRFEERDSLRDDAVSRPPRFEAFEEAAVFFDAAADFFAGAAAFFEPFAAADCGLKRNMAETASAIRQGNRNFGVIEPSSLKKQAEEAANGAVVNGRHRTGRVMRLGCFGRVLVCATSSATRRAPPVGAKLEVLKSHAEAFPSKPF